MLKIILLIFVFILPKLGFSEDLIDKQSMNSAYSAYKKILETIHSYDEDKKVNKFLLEQISILKKSLHNFETKNANNKMLVLDENLQNIFMELNYVEDLLKNNQGASLWAVSRLKSISSHCQNCHTTYKVNLSFKDTDIPKEFDKFERAELLLASRQFKDAEKDYWDYLMSGNYLEYGALHPLHRWLDLMVRVLVNPDEAQRKLAKLLVSNKLSKLENSEIEQWIVELKKWLNDGGKIYSDFSKNKNLIQDLINSEEPIYSNIDIITLLRAAAGFNKVIESKENPKSILKETYYLLGLVYVNLPVLYIYELPEVYLKACIRKYPGSLEAKKSFKLLKQYLTLVNTGSGGLHMNLSSRIELEELYSLANKKTK